MNQDTAPTSPKDDNAIATLTQERATKSNAIQIPEISLPKGGGALKGIDEKFEVNAANGTASFSVPLPITPGRNGFSPSLSLSYNSGGGNSPFGLGWSLDYPMIQRKTDKRLPRYRDGWEEDTFMFSGAEDLVPYLDREGSEWNRRQQERNDYILHQYRPRVEGGFARIERVVRKSDHFVYWKVTTRDNVTTFFGLSSESQLVDPDDGAKVFAWLPEFSYDDKGNWINYHYKAEDLSGVPNDLSERNRHNGIARFTNRYLKRVTYGNRKAWYADDPINPTLPATDAEHFFELVLDYGEHSAESTPAYKKGRPWTARPDAFSTYRSGFDIRTYRRCHNVLMFHHFADEEPFGDQYLVRALTMDYQPSSVNSSDQTEVSYLHSITQKGYIRQGNEHFEKSLPPLEFTYQSLQWNNTVRTVAPDNIVHAPVGLTNHYQWVDLYGEGIHGILTEQATGWYYKTNLGDTDGDRQVRFTHAKPVLPKPSFNGLAEGVLSIQDLAANGQKQVVVNSPGVQGYFELTEENDFQPFRSFEAVANVNLQDPNTRLLDLNGDGQPEIVMTEENLFTWYAADGKKGYQAAEFTTKPYEEEQGPALVFADTDQREAIFLADMSGDGLTDIVRVRNGEICYWANRGYGRFSAKVAMSNAPHFDYPEQFNPRYVQLADVSGTGATDIIYLGSNQFKAYLNLSGNAWSEAHEIEPTFPINSNTQLSVVDLLGTGTSCIVWSSDLPADRHAPMRYIDLMNSRKPHVLTQYVNNLGQETSLEYRSSTHFYLQDKLAGRPWMTKLPFPVQVVTKSVVEDKVTDVRFTTQYRYRHGYYDHAEREFRGFGMVEQVDTEEYTTWQANNAGNTLEKSEELYQPPTLTRTWFHTGAFLDRERILTQFQEEYWPQAYNRVFPEAPIGVTEPALADARVVVNQTLEGFLAIDALSANEYREALRACKGMMLRQEVFAQDAPVESPTPEEQQRAQKPFTVATHNCHIQLLQPREDHLYACFLVTESEALTIHYERDETDPRIAHTLNTKIDELGNVLEAATVVYSRKNRQAIEVSGLYERSIEKDAYIESLKKLEEEQKKTLITYTQNSFTQDIVQDNIYRLRQAAETKTFEISGLTPTAGLYRASDFASVLTGGSTAIGYHETASGSAPQRRLIEHVRTLYYDEDLAGALPLGQLGTHGIAYESYQLAYTPELLSNLFGNKITNANDLLGVEGKFVHSEGDTNWWIRSGHPRFMNANEDVGVVRGRFFSPLAYVSPFGAETKITYYRDYFLMIQATEDALQNHTEVERFNFRTLAPIRTKDINDNISEVLLDELGLVKAVALRGKGTEADQPDGLTEFTPQTERDTIQQYFTLTDTAALRTTAQSLLQGASTRFIYDFHRYRTSSVLRDEQLANNPDVLPCERVKYLPTVVGSIVREQHHAVNVDSPLQLSFEYSDGMGNVAMAKAQAEPGEALRLDIQPDCSYTLETRTAEQLRWIGNGRMVLNNKGNPVKQYEPYFSVNPFYEDHKELVERGVTPIIYYDALGRTVRTELPDGTFTKVTFDSWQQVSYDPNDTVQDSRWYDERINHRIDAELQAIGKDPDKEHRAAEQAARHHDTPTVLHLDTLGRPVLSVAHHRAAITDASGNSTMQDEFYSTIIILDIEGSARQVTDARSNTVMIYGYDMLGHRVYQRSMDAGETWTLNNVVGSPIRNWDSRSHIFRTQYDVLQRPTTIILQDANDVATIDKYVYGEGATDASARNLRGQVVEHYDSSGLMTSVRFDFKGNLLESKRQLAAAFDAEVVDWSEGAPTNRLESEIFTQETEYDALNRMNRLYNWHRDDQRVTVYEPTYNERGTLTAEDHITAAQRTATGHTGGRRATAVSGIQYDEKGQRTQIRYGNGTTTRYHYDPETFRLIQLRTTKSTTERFPTAPSNLSDPNVLQNLYYTYDPVGNTTELEDDAYEPVFFDNQQVEPKSRYTYDALYRLVQATGRENNTFDSAPTTKEPNPVVAPSLPKTDQTLRNYTQTYRYDAVGNILRVRHVASTERWTRTYSYAADSNRLLSTQTGSNPATTINYRYDAHGSMLNYQSTPTDLAWDYQDRVHQLDLGGGGTAFYQYAADRERSRKRIVRNGGVSEERIYLNGAELYRRWNGTSLLEEIETHHLFVNEHRILLVEEVVQTDNSQLNIGILDRYQYSNHLGSVGLELDGSGEIVSYEEYHPYGTVAYHMVNAIVKAAGKRYRYTGMERDEESGLNYHSARYYLPWLGRWLSADPIGIGDGVNVYVYSRNSPSKFSDLYGFQAKPSDEYYSPLDNLPNSPDAFGFSNKGRTSWDKKIESSKPFQELVSDIASETSVDPGLLAVIMLIENSDMSFWLSKSPVDSYQAGTDVFFMERAKIRKGWKESYERVDTVKNKQGKVEVDTHQNDSKDNPENVQTIKFKNGRSAALATALIIKLDESYAKNKQGEAKWNEMSTLEQMASIRYIYNAGIGVYKSRFDKSKLYEKLAKNEENPTIKEKEKIRKNKTKYSSAHRLAAVAAGQAMHISQKYFSVDSSHYEFHDVTFSEAFSIELTNSINNMSKKLE